MSNTHVIKDVRKNNLKLIISKIGSATSLADTVDTKRSYISQIVGKSGLRSVGDSLARKIEERLELPHGWMDTPHSLSYEDSDLADMNMPTPILGLTTHGPAFDWSDPELRKEKSEQFLMCRVHDSLAYALICSDPIPELGIRSGSVLLIDPSVTPVPGDDVFILLTSGSTVACRLSGHVGGQLLLTDVPAGQATHIDRADVEYMHWISGVMSSRTIRDKSELTESLTFQGNAISLKAK